MTTVRSSPPTKPNPAHVQGLECSGSSSIFSQEVWGEIGRSLNLSGRDLQIVRGTFDDKTELEIAVDLSIAPGTIHTHIERIHHKLVVTNRVQLLLRVMQEFLTLTAAPGSVLPPICADCGTLRCPRPI